MVVALSGLDGSGKSSQAELLRDELDRLGVRARIAWMSLTHHPPWLMRLSSSVKALLHPFARGTAEPASGADGAEPADPGKELRRRSRVVGFGWSLLLALQHGLTMRRLTAPARRRGEVVICDRYLLDAWVELHYDYGEVRSFGVHLALMRLLAPRPRHAYLLDIDPVAATERKADFDAAANARRAELYRAGHDGLGVRRLDGHRSIESLNAEIAAAVCGATPRGPAGSRHRSA
jgi:thymidylate kinase